MKKIIVLFLFIFSIICTGIIASAEMVNINGNYENVDFVDVYINGKRLESDNRAFVYHERTLVPLRAVGELLNYEIKWIKETQTAVISNEITIINMSINKYRINKKDRREFNGEERSIAIDVAPILYNNGTTMVPIRAISEAMNANVKWNSEKNCVEITMEYDTIYGFPKNNLYEGFSVVDNERGGVSKNGKCGFIDHNGKIAIPLEYDGMVGYFSEGLAPVKKKNLWGYIDRDGNVVIDFQYENAKLFNEGLAPYEKNGKWGFIDKTGKAVIAPTYEYVDNFFEGMAIVSKNGKYGVINNTGKVVQQPDYDDIIRYGYIGEGLALAGVNGRYGIINKNGKAIIPFQYNWFHVLGEGLIAAQKGDKWGFIDMNGIPKIAFEYDDAYYFENSKAYVLKDGEWFYIDKSGKRIK
ncbi:MAG: hypothetical protein E7404_04555 [Ruminococcaceae bacterium]|nr:hypothetical protein [Oscillospiraceae bacterium]